MPITLALALRAGERVHEADDGSGAAHVALHVLHAAGRLDRDAAGVEGHALADEGDGLVLRPCRRSSASPPCAAAAASPGRRRAARPCRASSSPSRSRISTSTPSLASAAAAVGELDRTEHVGRLVDQVAGEDDALGHGVGAAQALATPAGLGDGDADLDRLRLGARRPCGGLVPVEGIGAQPEAEGELGRRGGLDSGRRAVSSRTVAAVALPQAPIAEPPSRTQSQLLSSSGLPMPTTMSRSRRRRPARSDRESSSPCRVSQPSPPPRGTAAPAPSAVAAGPRARSGSAKTTTVPGGLARLGKADHGAVGHPNSLVSCGRSIRLDRGGRHLPARSGEGKRFSRRGATHRYRAPLRGRHSAHNRRRRRETQRRIASSEAP